MSREPVGVLDEQDVEEPRLGLAAQRGDAGAPVQRGAGLGVVVVHRHHRQLALPGVVPAELDLIVDRALALQVGREAGVDGGSHGRATAKRMPSS